jgi:4-carboxymuconolactone decarboxylase
LDLHDAEEKHTSLDERVRQVVILAIGAVWKSDYELYAHSAAARKAGLSENAIRTLATGGLPDDLSYREKVAQRYARQFSAEHRVDSALYRSAVQTFGEQGVVDLTYLIGIYHITCGLLNSFEIPAPD